MTTKYTRPQPDGQLAIDIAAMRRDKLSLMIATPLYGAPHAEYALDATRVLNAFTGYGLPCRLHWERGISLIAFARNLCVARFLATDSTHLLFWDGDLSRVSDHGDDVLRMLASDVPVLGGVYSQKRPDSTHVAVTLKPGGVQDGDKIEAVRLQGGFLMVRREVFELLARMRPDLKYETNAPELAGVDPHLFAFFEDGLDRTTRKWAGEDYSFCDLCVEHGIPLYADKRVVLRHHGERYWQVDPTTELKAMELVK